MPKQRLKKHTVLLTNLNSKPTFLKSVHASTHKHHLSTITSLNNSIFSLSGSRTCNCNSLNKTDLNSRVYLPTDFVFFNNYRPLSGPIGPSHPQVSYQLNTVLLAFPQADSQTWSKYCFQSAVGESTDTKGQIVESKSIAGFATARSGHPVGGCSRVSRNFNHPLIHLPTKRRLPQQAIRFDYLSVCVGCFSTGNILPLLLCAENR